MRHYDLAIIGAGPSGVMCAIEAARNGNNVILIDGNSSILKKLSVSGGGRCNISNTLTKEEFFNKMHNSKFFNSTFSNFSNLDLVEWLNENGLKTKVEKTKVFPLSDKSKEIVSLFSKLLRQAKVEVMLDTKVKQVVKSEDKFSIKTSEGDVTASKVVVAAGGVSYAALGSSDIALLIAKSFDIKVIDTYPTNCSLNLAISDKLMGVAIPNANVKYGKYETKGDILFTHFGITGPAVFGMTGEKEIHETISVGITNMSLDEFKEIANKSNKTMARTYKGLGPEKYVNYVMANDGELIANSVKKDALERVYNNLTNYTFKVKSKIEIDKAFTMGGGISLDEINPRTFEAKNIPCLYFIGECLDFFAPTGGFNISLCISMGKTCGEKI